MFLEVIVVDAGPAVNPDFWLSLIIYMDLDAREVGD